LRAALKRALPIRQRFVVKHHHAALVANIGYAVLRDRRNETRTALRQCRIAPFSHLVGQIDHGFPPDCCAPYSVEIARNASTISVNLHTHITVATYRGVRLGSKSSPPFASQYRVSAGLCLCPSPLPAPVSWGDIGLPCPGCAVTPEYRCCSPHP